MTVDEKDFGVQGIFPSSDNTSLVVSGYSKNLKKYAIAEDGSLKLE